MCAAFRRGAHWTIIEEEEGKCKIQPLLLPLLCFPLLAPRIQLISWLITSPGVDSETVHYPGNGPRIWFRLILFSFSPGFLHLSSIFKLKIEALRNKETKADLCDFKFHLSHNTACLKLNCRLRCSRWREGYSTWNFYTWRLRPEIPPGPSPFCKPFWQKSYPFSSSYDSTCEIPTLSYTWSVKLLPLSGGAYPYRPL